MTDINLLLNQAVKETVNVKRGEEFLLRELFKGYEWNRIPHKYRLLLGTLFLDYVNCELATVVPTKKTSSNQQKYKKIELSSPLGIGFDKKKSI
nr:single-stranded DNA-binding protein [uncultured Lachnoclostridium sp.]